MANQQIDREEDDDSEDSKLDFADYYLTDDETIAEFLTDALEEDDLRYLATTLGAIRTRAAV